MITISARGILLDIEGTTSSISFVHDVMFPYVRCNLTNYLAANWNSEAMIEAVAGLAADIAQPSASAWLAGKSVEEQQRIVQDTVIQMMDSDIKATGLKQLQGMIWKSGFHSGQLVAHLFSDVAPAIRSWHSAGVDVRIYSSGSIAAQKLFFGHTIEGNLLNCLGGHYDTTIGPKQSAASYAAIASKFSCPASQILFISDVPTELEAAKTAGYQTVLSLRPGNQTVNPAHGFATVVSFAELSVTAIPQTPISEIPVQ